MADKDAEIRMADEKLEEFYEMRMLELDEFRAVGNKPVESKSFA